MTIDTCGLALSGYSMDYIDGYERGYEAAIEDRTPHLFEQKQRNLYDCCLAAAATLAGVNYDAVFSKEFQVYIEEKKGTYGEDVDKVLAMVGLGRKGEGYSHITNYFGWNTNMETYEKFLRLNVLNQMLWGRRALLQVPSLNDAGKSHLIVWFYDRIWDPSTRKTYKDLSDVSFEHAWLINETPRS